MKTAFELIRDTINKQPADSSITAAQLKKACFLYFQQTVPMGTIAAYMVKMITCGYLKTTELTRIYKVGRIMPEDFKLLDLSAQYEAIKEQARIEKRPALEVQIGGDHYKKYPYQPIEFACDINLSFIQGNIVKYILRYADKNGQEGINKVIHYAELAIQLKHKPKCVAWTQQYIHKFCLDNKLDSIQVVIIKHVTKSEYPEIIKLLKSL